MSTPIIQTSFNAGEWAPALGARVDLTKYHTGAALLRNFFVDYRGGATTSPGTRYVITCLNSGQQVRVIPFQASLTVSYILEFGSGYIRFISNGAPIVEAAVAITGATQANPCVITAVAHGYISNQWVLITGVGGMTQLNGAYFIITVLTANTFFLSDLFGAPLDATAFTAYTAGGISQRIYTISSPFLASELAQVKFVQNVNTLILTHANHPPQVLTLISATSWTIGAITFGATIAAPAGLAAGSTLAAGTVNYSYLATAVDASGQESGPSTPIALANIQDIRAVAGTNTITWGAVTNAVSYNVYRAEPRYGAAVPSGASYGFAGNCSGNTFIDTNIDIDFSQGPPIPQNPFFGAGVASVTVTAAGSLTLSTNGIAVPTVSFTGGGGAGAAGYATLYTLSVVISNPGFSYAVGDLIAVYGTGGLTLRVDSVAGNTITSVSIANIGTSNTTVVGNPTPQASTNGFGMGAYFTVTWGLYSISLTNAGTGYAGAPAVGFNYGTWTATASLGATSAGNPTVPAIFDQRLGLMGPPGNPQQFNFSKPGALYNFDTTNPIQADNAISGTLFSGQLNTIQSAVPQPQGLIIFSDKQAWLLNGGSPGSPISAVQIAANSQAYNGASFPPPIVANDNILYVQAKGSIVRDLVFNFYTQVYTGTDISVLSSHLFYGFQLLEWAWAEEPFKLCWAVRNDGTLLTLTFLKEQELVAWAHRDTLGLFKSVATVTETTALGKTDAVYTVVQRSIRGVVIQYIERMIDIGFPSGATDAWQVDAGLQYNGAAALTFTGGQHLGSRSVTGLATDTLGNVTVIPAFTMPNTGTFTLTASPVTGAGYTRVTVGMPFISQLQTLGLDLGEPTVQGKRKKITGLTARVKDTLGLTAGRTFDASSQKVMKDLVLGNVGTMTNQLVTNLVTGDARIIIDPLWDVPGQYCIQQSLPYPASILGVIPEIQIGDSK